MYSLDINFLKDRKLDIQLSSDTFVKKKAGPPISAQIPLIVGGVIMVLLPAATGGTLLLLNAKKAATEQEVAQLDAQIAKLQGQSGQIPQKEAELDHVRQQTAAFVSLFENIKPWSALLRDLRDRIPLNVQVDFIQESEIAPAQSKNKPAAQAKDKPPAQGKDNPPAESEVKPPEGDTSKVPRMVLEIKGTADNYDQVNDFILSLQKSPFLKPEEIKLKSSELVDNPNELVLQEEKATNNSETEKPEKEKVVCEGTKCTVPLPNGDDKIFQLPKVVSYNIVAEINNTPANQLITALRQTGAVGLISRLQNLEQKGALTR